MTSGTITDELLARFFAGEATPEEAMIVEDWKDESVPNQSYFEEFAQIYETIRSTHENSATLSAWQVVRESIDQYEEAKRIRIKRWRIGIAASVALLVTISLLVFLFSEKETPQLVYRTEDGKRKIQLPDASEITLAAHSELTISKDFDKADRHVYLRGAAFFVIKHDPVKPLIIDMHKLYVKDLGTQFYINSSLNNDTVFVYVHEGEALLYDDEGATVILQAGHKAFYVRSSKKLAFLEHKEAVTKSKITASDSLPLVDKDWKHLVKETCDTCKTKLPEKAVTADSARKTKEPVMGKDARNAEPAKTGRD